MKIEPLKPLDAAKMMFNLNEDNNTFLEKFPDVNKLLNHKIFKDSHLTPYEVKRIHYLQNDMTLDQIYKNHEEERN